MNFSTMKPPRMADKGDLERRYETSDSRAQPVIDDQQNSGLPVPKPEDEERPCQSPDSILDALDMAGVEDVDIVFERPVSNPRPAGLD